VADDIDPAYAEALRVARERGVETLGLRLAISDDGLRVAGECPVEP